MSVPWECGAPIEMQFTMEATKITEKTREKPKRSALRVGACPE